MRLTGYLIFEICKTCNLGKVHPECPNTHPSRFAAVDGDETVSDAQIIDIAAEMHEVHGFRGRVGFHYYNEPLMAEDRLWAITEAISDRIPRARYTLWTNGTRWPKLPERLTRFEEVHLTDYGLTLHPVDRDGWKSIVPHVHFHTWPLDRRTTVEPLHSMQPCRRMFTEFVIDYYGNVHLCCYDWRGLGSPGNVHKDKIGDMVAKWQRIRDSISGHMMTPEAPESCRTCAMRSSGISRFVPEVAEEAERYARALP